MGVLQRSAGRATLLWTFGAATLACDKKPAAESAASATAAQQRVAAPTADPPPAPAAPAASVAAALNPIEGACNAICERSRTLKCSHPDACAPNCLGAATGTPCSDEFLAFYRCLVPQPLANWECSDDGVAAIREGYCDGEQARALGCMEARAPH